MNPFTRLGHIGRNLRNGYPWYWVTEPHFYKPLPLPQPPPPPRDPFRSPELPLLSTVYARSGPITYVWVQAGDARLVPVPVGVQGYTPAATDRGYHVTYDYRGVPTFCPLR